MEVHRHAVAFQNVKAAANNLNSIFMSDEKLKNQLKELAPKILLLTYDPNKDVSNALQQLWNFLA